MYPRLRDLREDNDMTQAALAKLLGMSQTGYSKYETGENDVPTQIYIKNSIFRNSLIFQGLPPIKYQNLMYFPLFLPL